MPVNSPIPAVKFIYKVCDSDVWQVARQTGTFIGAEIDLQDGYIHFSTARQLRDTLVRHFTGRDGLVLLKIELNELDIVWEAARDGDLFPHLYDHLPLSSVVAEYELKRSPNGDHIIPDDCLYQS